MSENDIFFNSAELKGYSEYSFNSIRPDNLIIADKVKINLKDGTIQFLEGYNPDEASQKFWYYLVDDYKDYLKWKNQSDSKQTNSGVDAQDQ